MGTLKPQSNGPLYMNTKLVHWPLMGGLLHLVQRGGAWAGANFMSFDVALCQSLCKPSVIPELSMGWVNPRVELGWVGSRFFIFGGLGWVVGPKRQKHKN